MDSGGLEMEASRVGITKPDGSAEAEEAHVSLVARGTDDVTEASATANDSCHGDEQGNVEESAAKQPDVTCDKPVVPMEIVKSPWASESGLIEISLNADTANKAPSVFHIVIDQPATVAQARSQDSVIASGGAQPPTHDPITTDSVARQAAAAAAVGQPVAGAQPPKQATLELRELPPNCPIWATRLRDCEEIGNSYRGYVESEVELDLVLTYHRQQTLTTWGTRQSPSTARESKRLMWKSNYVPYDGIPFLNLGSRAIVMECQYGPRRKGGPHKRAESPKRASKETCTCPARIYVKKVRKFPDFQVDVSLDADKITLKRQMDKVFQVMKEVGVDEIPGVERFYVQLPTNAAHQYHRTPEYQFKKDPVSLDATARSRLHPQLSDKIRELVAHGEINAYLIRQILRGHVTRTMFAGANLPEKHNLFYFPTINDIKNHVLLAIAAIEKGELDAVVPITITDARAITEPPPSSLSSSQMTFGTQLWESTEDQEEQDSKIRPQTQSVTVTLTQNAEEGGSFISQVETQLSDGTTFISDSLTPETARLLSQINQHCQEVHGSPEDALSMHQIVSSEQEEMDQSDNLLEEPKSITSGLDQSEEIIDAQKNDPTLNSQSDALMGLSVDASSEDGNNQPETLLPAEDDTAQSDALLEAAHSTLGHSEGLLGDTSTVGAIGQSKHLLDSDPTAIDQSGALLHSADELNQPDADLGSSASLETRPLLSGIEPETPVSKRARFEA